MLRPKWAHYARSTKVIDFVPSGTEQHSVIDSQAPLTVVLGGAGTGKTTCALAAARAHVERLHSNQDGRALFLSFSRASVSRIADRGRGILGKSQDFIEISTFHALSFAIIRKFGTLIGHPRATLTSPAEHLINPNSDALGYEDLLPLAIKIMDSSPVVLRHLQDRWGLVIVDEFQDTGDLQQEILSRISAHARTILLGDPNQCIYTFLRRQGVRHERIREACHRAGSENTIELPPASHRDPSGVIPAVASAIMRRQFDSEAISTAVETGRLIVHGGITEIDEVNVLTGWVTDLHAEGQSVAVFSHHNDILATLSDGLLQNSIDHEIVGLSDTLSAALVAQVEMLKFSIEETTWNKVLNKLAVFVTSSVRGGRVPQLANHIIEDTGTQVRREKIKTLRDNLTDKSLDKSINLAENAHSSIDLPNKINAWAHATTILRSIRARAIYTLGPQATEKEMVSFISNTSQETTYSLLTDIMEKPQNIHLMNLYQTKGREADATVVVLRSNDFFGYENREPFAETSRLMYVVFSRARKKIVVLLVGSGLPPVIAPLARLAQ